MPFEEIFIGSNYKSYKHKYYLMYVSYNDSIDTSKYEECEVSKMEWKSYDDCIKDIRSYNLEKKRLITNIHQTIKKNFIEISLINNEKIIYVLNRFSIF